MLNQPDAIEIRVVVMQTFFDVTTESQHVLWATKPDLPQSVKSCIEKAMHSVV